MYAIRLIRKLKVKINLVTAKFALIFFYGNHYNIKVASGEHSTLEHYQHVHLKGGSSVLKKIFLRSLWIMTLVIVIMIVPSVRFLFSAASLGSAVPDHITLTWRDDP
ncbi:hypothetical protein SAMN04515679_2008 [Pelosinus fermentans]|uniref:Uncharacterized protein n=2 Tax=Sporomusaceae TaxID=1843490 RepID=I8RH29_9FIRM|nr:hypothetical protein FB4_4506 [Pelosinus fermentans B4]EIW23051.1 hypothetical protein FA11_4492 [Pelosinus fermentans A11]OAM93907.1 hypothetical protein FR7_01924 [Pelosinus fermentans DSM 17108]SDQ94092.1 hypothetical protein SAMN04515679_2008 [Pelosinus fermentans]